MKKKSPIFREKNLEKISSPEQLTDYIRIIGPGVWIVLAAVIVLLVSVLVWGIFGALPDVVTVNGVAANGIVTCYVEDPNNLSAGMEAEVDGMAGEVTAVGTIPFSKDEIAEIYQKDYTLHMLDVADWNYEVIVQADGIPDGLVEVVIIGEAVHPISFLTEGVSS